MCIMLIVHLSQKVDHVNVHLPRWANQLRSLAWMVEQEQTTVTIMGENRHVSKVLALLIDDELCKIDQWH